MKNFRIGFIFNKRRPDIVWAMYTVATATAVSLIVYYGNALLSSKHGEFLRDAVCAAAKVFPDGDVARILSSACRASKDGVITPDEAKIVLGRVQQATGGFDEYFDNDPTNTDLRAEDEVDFAIEKWERENPGPEIDSALREQFPNFTEEQLCVLSQAERYTEGDAIGIRYNGMEVCEE